MHTHRNSAVHTHSHTHTHTHTHSQVDHIVEERATRRLRPHTTTYLASSYHCIQVDQIVEERATRRLQVPLEIKKNDPLWQDFGAGQVVMVFGLLKVYMCPILLYMCSHAAMHVPIYVSSYYLCVLILFMCPHTIYVSSYYICVLI